MNGPVATEAESCHCHSASLLPPAYLDPATSVAEPCCIPAAFLVGPWSSRCAICQWQPIAVDSCSERHGSGVAVGVFLHAPCHLRALEPTMLFSSFSFENGTLGLQAHSNPSAFHSLVFPPLLFRSPRVTSRDCHASHRVTNCVQILEGYHVPLRWSEP
ncbi:hypothetical protein K432DRAFT_432918 [Lepidopterella palustris CBS 459.81]|uniref:Uncharacterized protein n=1 Tax=Lepidopterella palustris CBS 459.81 TaxID=1314670 RepID=A0A8E2EGA8_9PEZI|nr:hypothetical protein K432DRAFT_432918 [Lepidopterella palustris CBS 459.81]